MNRLDVLRAHLMHSMDSTAAPHAHAQPAAGATRPPPAAAFVVAAPHNTPLHTTTLQNPAIFHGVAPRPAPLRAGGE